MQVYISVLRGINVSGKNILKMDALREMYEKLGFSSVSTYVQSGNVVFKSSETDPQILATQISTQIKTTVGLDVPVLVLSVENLTKTIQENPFLNDTEKDPAFFHVTFLAEKPTEFNSQNFTEKKSPTEAFHYVDTRFYIYCPLGYGQTKLTNNFIEAKLKVTATTRNWKTTNALLDRALTIEAKI